MNIDKGEFFVVKRGFKLGSLPPIFGHQSNDDEPSYDRSLEGLVFVAREICGDHIAASCVYADFEFKKKSIGGAFSLNTTEIEVWPVTHQYVKALGVDVKGILKIIKDIALKGMKE